MNKKKVIVMTGFTKDFEEIEEKERMEFKKLRGIVEKNPKIPIL